MLLFNTLVVKNHYLQKKNSTTSYISAPFKYNLNYFLNERPFWEKRRVLIRGRRLLNISRQKGGAN